MKLQLKLFLLLLTLAPANSLADTFGNTLFLPNSIIPNGCTIPNFSLEDNVIRMIAVYEEDNILNESYYCEKGYYLPANSTECAYCPENSYCSGGEYAFQETIPQGITICPDGMNSPSGTTDVDHCGKKMYIAENELYLTQKQLTKPALAVRLDGKIYYAKMTPVSAYHNPIILMDFLRAKLDEIEYYIHDNSILGEINQ